jgi:ATP-binding cassette, subfamily B, multidrug efflux pump
MMGMDGGRRLFEQEVVKPKNLGATIRRFAYYFRHHGLALLIVLLLTIFGTWTQIYSPKLTGQAVDCYIFNPEELAQMQALSGSEGAIEDSCWFTDDDAAAITARINADESIAQADKASAITAAKIAGLGKLVLLLVGLFLVGAALNGIAFYTMSRTGHNVLRAIRKDLFRHMNRLSLSFYSKNEAGDIMSRITNDTDTIQQVFSFALLNVFSGIMLIIWIMYEMLAANVIYALITLSVVPIMLAATMYFSGQARKAFRISRKEMGGVNADLQESLSGAREVQAFNREEENIERFMETNAANRDANIRAAAFTSALNPVLEALGYVALAIVVVAGGYSLLKNEPLLGIGAVVTIGLVVTFIQYAQRFSQPITQIAILWTNIQSAIAGGERIFGLLDTEIDILDKPNAKTMPEIKGNVQFENVWAEYEKGEPVLKGVSFEAKAGQTVAIVGPTGAGKTTIINLLPRFYDVTQGAVMIDGYDVRDVTLESLRSQIGIVLQDSFLFSDTVMNNIRYGKLDATDEEVIAAAKLVAADSFIERLPDGYNTILGERGSGLSQGQRQLISIARAALLDPHILILDEATSSVDTRTERVIQAAFEKLLEGRTSFVIAHRLSTIRNADLLLVVNHGDIVERGTHESLLAAKGEYYDLYMSQFRYEGDEESSEPVNGHSGEEEPTPAGD